ncbi:YqhG family protein [Alkalibacillus haloalkaliphilus]|uniref:YqhG family protein n=1 Tax=Alkalibacillus haloalkaliphilus TaxID=94136 RepID=UPI0029354658|nr:YqhG family protein [Alkalibacillus haloalkaliphilus]MDV2580972.1 YqhG family protein [Alkalibacillus haloalkaliphilus]
MKQAEIHGFLYEFFDHRQASILENHDGLLTVKLTRELDQQLMNRPFYWQYINTMGYEGEPMTVTYKSKEGVEADGEWIHFGSPRLQQIFNVIQEEGRYTTLYENISGNTKRTPLYPWFVCNLQVKYRGWYIHDEMVSIGILLTNGTMRFNWIDENIDQHFVQHVPDYAYKIPYIISPERSIEHLTKELSNRIEQESTSFSEKSIELYNQELNMLDELTELHTEEDQQFYDQSKEQIYERLYPKVEVNWINGGLFYLTQERTRQLTTSQ